MEQRNLEPVQPERKPFSTGDSQRLALAIKANLISEVDSLALDKVFSYAFMKLGLRGHNLPDPIETLLLHDHVRQNYGKRTTDEVRLAFDMAITGKLELKSEEVACYENFSCTYFSRIMNAYQAWARNEIKFLPQKKPLPPEVTVEYGDKTMMDWLASIIERVKANENYPIEFIPGSLYEWLDQKGMITVSNTRKNECMDKAILLYAKTLGKNARDNPHEQNIQRKDHFHSMQMNKKFFGEDLDIVKALAKRILLFELIKAEEITF